ncbi:hypothetical protein M0804_011444 [Polistes exclamans]|nr:hypothetical protein M0804_011444 [Polistes exclamans]
MCWQERAELLLLRYASRWARRFVRRRLDLVIDSQDRNRSITGLSVPPRHCVSARCPCQFIEDHLKYKPRGKLTLSSRTKGVGTSRYISSLNRNSIKTIKCMILRYPPGFTWCAYFNDPMIRFDAIPAY